MSAIRTLFERVTGRPYYTGSRASQDYGHPPAHRDAEAVDRPDQQQPAEPLTEPFAEPIRVVRHIDWPS